MSHPAPINATSISFFYVEAEDRLALLVGARTGDRLAMMATRRLAVRLVNGLAALLERTSAVAQEAPAKFRSDIVMFEHQGALVGADRASPSPTADPAPPAQARRRVASLLLDAVDVTTHPNRFTLVFKTGGRALAIMEVNRTDLHRVVAVLRRKCENANWRVPIEALWLDPPTGSVTLN